MLDKMEAIAAWCCYDLHQRGKFQSSKHSYLRQCIPLRAVWSFVVSKSLPHRAYVLVNGATGCLMTFWP
jgi:hypothetical protein